jgi:hypothetical protein
VDASVIALAERLSERKLATLDIATSVWCGPRMSRLSRCCLPKAGKPYRFRPLTVSLAMRAIVAPRTRR